MQSGTKQVFAKKAAGEGGIRRRRQKIRDGEFALELRSQITPLFQQLASLAADGLFTIDSKAAASSVQ